MRGSVFRCPSPTRACRRCSLRFNQAGKGNSLTGRNAKQEKERRGKEIWIHLIFVDGKNAVSTLQMFLVWNKSMACTRSSNCFFCPPLALISSMLSLTRLHFVPNWSNYLFIHLCKKERRKSIFTNVHAEQPEVGVETNGDRDFAHKWKPLSNPVCFPWTTCRSSRSAVRSRLEF